MAVVTKLFPLPPKRGQETELQVGRIGAIHRAEHQRIAAEVSRLATERWAGAPGKVTGRSPTGRPLRKPQWARSSASAAGHPLG